jgi:hypothetical protein
VVHECELSYGTVPFDSDHISEADLIRSHQVVKLIGMVRRFLPLRGL